MVFTNSLLTSRSDFDTTVEMCDLTVLDEYTAKPPDPRWSACKVAPHVSTNPAYHWARMLSMYLVAYLGASGYEVQPWTD